MTSQRVTDRRLHTIDEIVAVAVEVMASGGAPELSLGEIARRMGMRTPSLYSYFPSKAALCDEIFARGWRDLATVMEPHYQPLGDLSRAAVHREMTSAISTFVGWALDHSAVAELMFWRPIPAWEPSPQAFAAAGVVVDRLTAWIADLRRRGALRDDVEAAEPADLVMIMAAGVITQQLANQPGADIRSGRFSARIEALVTMFLSRYASDGARPAPPSADRQE